MDKNTIIGTILIAILFIGYMFYSSQQAIDEQEAEQSEQTTEELTEADSSTEESSNITESTTPGAGEITQQFDSTYSDDSTLVVTEIEEQRPSMIAGVFPIDPEFEEDLIIVENSELIIGFNSLGAAIEYVELKNYNDAHGNLVKLFEGNGWKQDFTFPVKEPGNDYNVNTIHTASLPFEIESISEKGVVFRAYAMNGGYVQLSYNISADFMVDMDMSLVDLNQYADNISSNIELNWNAELLSQESSLENERKYSSVYYRVNKDDVDNLSLTKDDEEEVSDRIDWIAYKQQFFNSTMIYNDGFASGEVEVKFNEDDTGYVKKYASHLYLDYKSGLPQQDFSFSFFFGPNHYNTLKALDNDMEELVQLSADFFLFGWVKYINRWVIIPLFNQLEKVTTNYGLIILIMTLIIKICLSPLTFKSYKSSAKMKLLKPELDELKEKYKDDQQKFGTEQWKLYQKAGVSPFSGCVPMILQFPILIAMFYFFPGSIELRQQAFLWATDLSTYDEIISFSAAIPLIGNHISLFTILMTVTSLITALTNTQMNAAGAQGALKYMPYFFPIFLFFIFNNFPAALTYYYFLSNLITIGQQFVIKKFFIDEDKLHQQIQQNKAKPRKKGGFTSRLEEAYKEQQKRQEQIKKGQGDRKTRRKK